MAATALFIFFLIPVSIILGVLMAAVFYRAACSVAKKVAGPEPAKASFTDYVPNYNPATPSSAPSLTEKNPFSSPSIYQNVASRNNRDDLSPSFGLAMLIVFVVGLTSIIIALMLVFLAGFVNMLAFQNAPARLPNDLNILLRVALLVIQFGLSILFSRLLLQTTWRRASLVAFFYYLITIAFAIVVGLVVLGVGFALSAM